MIGRVAECLKNKKEKISFGCVWRPQIYCIHDNSVTTLVLDGSPPHYFISAAGILSFRMDTPKFPRYDVTAELSIGTPISW